MIKIKMKVIKIQKMMNLKVLNLQRNKRIIKTMELKKMKKIIRKKDPKKKFQNPNNKKMKK